MRELDGRLALAKFPAQPDETSVVRWEAVALTPAFQCAIPVPAKARKVARDVAQQVRQWRQVAADLGIGEPEIERMRSAFEHADLDAALAG